MNEKMKADRSWSPEESEGFYRDLLEKALLVIPESGAVMVAGPMFILRSPEENFALFEQAHSKLREEGKSVFNQLPFVDYNLPEAPFDYETKFRVFYKGLIHSGKISACYLLPDWEQSEGTKTEVAYCKEAGIPAFEI